jgi:hypothetical protein
VALAHVRQCVVSRRTYGGNYIAKASHDTDVSTHLIATRIESSNGTDGDDSAEVLQLPCRR